MSKENNIAIREVLTEMEKKFNQSLQENEMKLIENNKEYYRIALDKEFRGFMNDKSHRDIEVPDKIYEDKLNIEKEIRALKSKISRFEDFKKQTEKQLQD